jgi:hypothetical protein
MSLDEQLFEKLVAFAEEKKAGSVTDLRKHWAAFETNPNRWEAMWARQHISTRLQLARAFAEVAGSRHHLAGFCTENAIIAPFLFGGYAWAEITSAAFDIKTFWPIFVNRYLTAEE